MAAYSISSGRFCSRNASYPSVNVASLVAATFSFSSLRSLGLADSEEALFSCLDTNLSVLMLPT